MGDNSPITRNHTQAELWAERSKPLPYDVYLNVQDADNVLSLLSPLFPAVRRWRRLIISGEHQEDVFITPVDSVNTMCVSICDVSTTDDSATNLPKGTFIPLSTRRPNALAVNISLTQLPSPYTLRSLRFTSLSITEQCITIHLEPRTILEFLSSCPLLQHFCLVGWIHADEHPPSSNLPIVPLLHLHTLQLRSTCLARNILSAIHAPNLQQLFLAHLNVDFQLPFPAEDSGDSEDEANDFSQSPWSDHATGMGLRALIKRSNPPIRVLEMDFTDMRTKDFIYLFDRLVHLEVFLIVASDMSNTVINLLRPTRTRLITSLRENESDIVEAKLTYHLRLPLLRKLELYNCHRLSGDAIVDTFRARVRYTDLVTAARQSGRDRTVFVEGSLMDTSPLGLMNTLGELAIVGCEDFTFRHSQLLLKEMGDRLRTE